MYSFVGLLVAQMVIMTGAASQYRGEFRNDLVRSCHWSLLTFAAIDSFRISSESRGLPWRPRMQLG